MQTFSLDPFLGPWDAKYTNVGPDARGWAEQRAQEERDKAAAEDAKRRNALGYAQLEGENSRANARLQFEQGAHKQANDWKAAELTKEYLLSSPADRAAIESQLNVAGYKFIPGQGLVPAGEGPGAPPTPPQAAPQQALPSPLNPLGEAPPQGPIKVEVGPNAQGDWITQRGPTTDAAGVQWENVNPQETNRFPGASPPKTAYGQAVAGGTSPEVAWADESERRSDQSAQRTAASREIPADVYRRAPGGAPLRPATPEEQQSQWEGQNPTLAQIDAQRAAAPPMSDARLHGIPQPSEEQMRAGWDTTDQEARGLLAKPQPAQELMPLTGIPSGPAKTDQAVPPATPETPPPQPAQQQPLMLTDPTGRPMTQVKPYQNQDVEQLVGTFKSWSGAAADPDEKTANKIGEDTLRANYVKFGASKAYKDAVDARDAYLQKMRATEAANAQRTRYAKSGSDKSVDNEWKYQVQADNMVKDAVDKANKQGNLLAVTKVEQMADTIESELAAAQKTGNWAPAWQAMKSLSTTTDGVRQTDRDVYQRVSATGLLDYIQYAMNKVTDEGAFPPKMIAGLKTTSNSMLEVSKKVRTDTANKVYRDTFNRFKPMVQKGFFTTGDALDRAAAAGEAIGGLGWTAPQGRTSMDRDLDHMAGPGEGPHAAPGDTKTAVSALRQWSSKTKKTEK
jgi:hypothetical protein